MPFYEDWRKERRIMKIDWKVKNRFWSKVHIGVEAQLKRKKNGKR